MSEEFGAKKCAVHSPSAKFPGAIGRRLSDQALAEGYDLALERIKPERALIEVYPHVALLSLMRASERIPYKVSKNVSYWGSETPINERKQKLVNQWREILHSLRDHADGIDLHLPATPEGCTFNFLKRYEDAIDALICAWMAVRYLNGSARALGDDTAAIWVPER